MKETNDKGRKTTTNEMILNDCECKPLSLTGTRSTQKCNAKTEGNADEVGQNRRNCPGTAVDPWFRLGFFVLNHD